MGVVEFQVDKARRRKATLAHVVNTTGGKAALVAIVVCVVATFAVPAYMTVALDGWLADEAIFAFCGFLALSIIAIGATWRQRTAGVTVRKDERLVLQGAVLDYSFHASADRFPNSLNVVRIDLTEAVVRFDEATSAYIFDGGIRWHYYRNPSNEPQLAFYEMKSIPTYEIGAYFDQAFDAVMRERIAAKERETR